MPSREVFEQYCFLSIMFGDLCIFSEVQLPYPFTLLLKAEVKSYFEVGPSDSRVTLTTGIFKENTQSNENVGKTVGAGNVVLSIHFLIHQQVILKSLLQYSGA